MGNINVLSFEVANLIAAGEVVDRPASVLKELLENAIDAGARCIVAEICAGGTSRIRVSDDGCGMSAEDLPVAIRRHATSKIRSASDLSAIGTLGFRGEALAAIAAVSELQILTKRKEAPAGTLLASSGGRVTDISEVGVGDGTTVIVENLFANVPARRKFLKKDATETMAATAVVEKIAMSRPDISFEWITDGTTRFRTAGDGQLKNALYAILGRDFANRLLAIDGGTTAVKVSGFVGAPDNVRANRNHQNTFINGRYVKSKTVMAALEKAAISYVAGERFPVSALFLEIDPALVDVNVHPAKLEVKFSDERAVFEAVYYAVRSAFEANTTRPELILPKERPTQKSDAAFQREAFSRADQIRVDAPARTMPSAAPVKRSEATKGNSLSVKEALANLHAFREDSERTVRTLDYSTALGADSDLKKEKDEGNLVFRADLRAALNPNRFASAEKDTAPSEKAVLLDPVMAAEKRSVPDPIPQSAPDYRLVGEAFRCYLIVERGEELLLIDKHAAHERIIFEDLLAAHKKSGRSASQSLLVALPVPLADAEYAAAREYEDELARVGFAYTLDDISRTASVSAVPGAISTEGAADLFVKMCTELAEGTGTPDMTEEKRIERSLYTVACKAAIKGGRAYGEAQTAWLVDRVMALPDITVCPHGRPIAIRLTKTYLDREFDRIM